MDSLFRSAREKLEKEHRERKENGKLKLEQEKKAKDAAERQREAIEASHRERRIASIESQMNKVEENLGEGKEEDLKPRGGDSSMQSSPQWIFNQGMKMKQETKVDGGSDKDTKLLYAYRKAYYAGLLDQLGGAEEEDDDDTEWLAGQAPADTGLQHEDSSLQTFPQWLIMQEMNLTEEQRGGMRQEENVDGGSGKVSKKLLYAYRKAYYSALLDQQGGPEEEDEEDAEWEEEESLATENGNNKRLT